MQPMALRSRNPNVQQAPDGQHPGKDGPHGHHQQNKRQAGHGVAPAGKAGAAAAEGLEKDMARKDTEPKAKRRAPLMDLNLRQQPQPSAIAPRAKEPPSAAISEQPSQLRMELSNVRIDSAKRTTVDARFAIGLQDEKGSVEMAVLGECVVELAAGDENEPIGKRTRSRSSALDTSKEEGSSPHPEFDFDRENLNDIAAVSLYATDIFRWYQYREGFFKLGNYLPRQPNISTASRANIANWLVEMQETFELNHETLYLGTKLFDLYFDRMAHRVGDGKLPLIGSAAMFIASKFDERSPPLIDDFIYLIDDRFNIQYDRDEFMAMERELFNVVGFDLGAPLSYRFLRRYARVTKTEMGTLTLARYILETSLMFVDFCRVSESLMGAAAYLLAVRMKGVGDWCAVVEHYSGYRAADVEPLMWALNHMVIKRHVEYPDLDTVHRKYSHEIFYEVALTPSLEDRFPLTAPIAPPADLISSGASSSSSARPQPIRGGRRGHH